MNNKLKDMFGEKNTDKYSESRWEYVMPANIAENGYCGLCSLLKFIS